jgi:uncharacterized protein
MLQAMAVARPGSAPPDLEDVVQVVTAYRLELERRGVRYLAVFGSVARGDARPDSDIDLLVEREYLPGADLEEFLEDLFGRHVDLVPRAYVKKRLKARIEREAIQLIPEYDRGHVIPDNSPREWRHFVDDMIEAAEDIVAKTAGSTEEAIAADQDVRKILAWNFQMMGEAERNLPRPIKDAHPEIPWRNIREMRNRVVHGYWSIDAKIVLEVATTEVPLLIEPLRSLLSEG